MTDDFLRYLLERWLHSRNAVQVAVTVLVLWLMAVGLAVTVFMILYWVKCALGIDIFPDRHLRDFLF